MINVTEMIGFELCFCRRTKTRVRLSQDPGSNYTVIIRSNSRGFALERVCVTRARLEATDGLSTFEGQLNPVEGPTTAVLFRETRIRTGSCTLAHQSYRPISRR